MLNITVTDPITGCDSSISLLILQPSQVTLTASTTPVTINGASDGTITATASNGTAGYTYQLDSNGVIIQSFSATNIFTGLPASCYTISTMDANSCLTTTTVCIATPTIVTININSTTNILCFGNNTGSINATANGGVPFVGSNYNWVIYKSSTDSTVYNNVNPNTFATLTSGTYTIKAVDANGGSTSTIVTLTQPLAPLGITNIATVTPQCNPNNNGSITVSASGGTGAINYTATNTATLIQYGPSAIGNTIGGLIAGNYNVQVYDANGCDTNFVVNLIQLPKPIITALSATDEFCNPDSNGTISITATGGVGIIKYNLVNNYTTAGSSPLTGLVTGTYNVFAIDSAGCFEDTIISIIHKPNPVINGVVTTQTNCNPNNTGTATITATGNTMTYSINGGSFNSSNVFNNLVAGNHTLTVKDSFGCTHDTIINISTISNPTISFNSAVPAGCNPNNNGSFELSTSATGSTVAMSPNIGSISMAAGIISASNLTAQCYTVTATDGLTGCTTTTQVCITTTVALAITSTTFTPNLCFGDQTASISIAANAGIDTFYAYSGSSTWANTQNDTISSLPAGSFLLVVVDSNGCKDSSNIIVTQPTAVGFNAPILTKITCNGDSNGVFNVTATGGVAGYNYSINVIPSSNTNGLFNGLAAGSYTVTVADANGCSTNTAGIIQNVAPIVFSPTTLTNIDCYGNATGSICVTASGGNTGGLTLTTNNILNVYTAPCFNNLIAGSYTITATDLLGCTASIIDSLSQPTPILIAIDSLKHVSCFGESNANIHVLASGGAGTYTYQFNNSGAFTSTANIQNGLAAGTYTFIAKDANNCTTSIVQIITQPTVLALDSFAFTHVTCFGMANGTIKTGITGGTTPYTITLVPNPLGLIFNNSSPIMALDTGNYVMSVVDLNGCTIDTAITITQPLPLVPISVLTHVSCFGGSNGEIEIIQPLGGTPPYLYTFDGGATWSPDLDTAGLAAGTFTIGVKDAQNCIQIDTVIILQPNAPLSLVGAPIVVNVLCYGDSTGSIIIKASGGTQLTGGVKYTYTLNGNVSANTLQNAVDSTVTFTALKAGLYVITVIDANGCTISTIVNVSQNLQMLFTKLDYKQPRCFGEFNGTISVAGTGGVPAITYQLLPTNPVFQASGNYTGLPAQLYTITLQDAVGCMIDTTFDLPEPDELLFSQVNVTDVSCEGAKDGTLIVDAIGGNGGNIYQVVPGVRINSTGVFVGFDPGTYIVTVTDSLGCIADSEVVIRLSATPLALASTATHITNCNGYGEDGAASTQTIGGFGPFTYLWNTTPPQTNATAIKLTPGFYVVEVTDAHGCMQHDTIEIEAANCCTTVFLPTVFSPNNDGNNDKFRGINAVALDIQLLDFNIYDRWGNRVFNTVGLSDAWNGMFRDVPAEEGVYQYMYRYKCLIDNKIYLLKGDVMLVR